MSDWIDITRILTSGMIQWPGDLPFSRQQYLEISVPGTGNVSEITTSVHAGTHIEAPLHFLKEGMDITEVALFKLCGPAIVVDIPQARDVSIEDLQSADIQVGERVLLKTANQYLWEKPEFDENYFAITVEAAMWLVDHNVPAVGIDYLSVDRYQNHNHPVHHALLGNGVIIIEGLDLSGADPGHYEMVALPLKIAGSEASPGRVIIRRLVSQKRPPQERKQ